ncbi:MAG: hypothetical protein C0404_10480 [Verrucomicrobia bacterium]|nr:hypothetical protein [Verrucomicrobiota bacterium]
MKTKTGNARMHNEMSVASLEEARRFYPAPGNRRAYLQQPCDTRIVVARPDLKFQLYNALCAGLKTGFGFVLLVDGKPVSLDFDRVEQRFDCGALPILSQRISQAGFHFHQESFTTRDALGRGVVMLRLTVWRQAGEPAALELGFLMTRASGGAYSTLGNEDYIPFEPWGAAWEKPFAWQGNETGLNDGEFMMALCRHSAGVVVHPPGGGPGAVAWTFHVDVRRDTPETIEIRVPYECRSKPAGPGDKGLDFRADLAFSLAQQDELAALSFDGERERQRLYWLGQLARGARIQVPEPVVQEVYQTLTLNNLQFLGGSHGLSSCRPGQGGYNDFAMVYAWEASHYLVPMARLGYHAELNRVLDYLLTTQKKPGDRNGPEGDVSDIEGCFRPHIHWMNETGAVLQIFAEYAFASGDFARLRADAGALLKAARWIQRQRNRTRDMLPGGGKALHYGLLPKGRPHDWPIRGHFLFSDTYTWSGLNRLAQAFAAAGLPDAGWLRQEADDYRECILSAVRGSLKPHPRDPSVKWVPSDIYEDPVEAIKTTIFCGPMSLIGSGILDSGDELVAQIEECLRVSGCMNEHFAFRMRFMEDKECRERQLAAAGGHVDLYYVTFAELPWHRAWLERGERAKAQAFFYMTLAYAISRDLHLAQERFCPQLPWLLPWQPNAGANGRIISMILANLCFVRDGVCHLFQGVPDAWFAARAPMGVDGLWIGGSRLSFRLEPGDGNTGWRFSYECDGPWVPELFRLALPGEGGGRLLKDFSTQGRKTGRAVL